MIRQSRIANFVLLFLAMLLFLVFVSDDSEAATITVDKFGGSDYTNITQAVDNASASDTIRVASRTYHDAVDVDKRLTIIGGYYGSDIGDIYNCNDGDLIANYAFDENGGSDAYDGVWCNDLDGDIEGASWATGVWNGGLDFDGSNDYVDIDDDNVLDFTSSMSVGAWINSDEGAGEQAIVSKWFNSGSNAKAYDFRILDSGKVRLNLDIDGTTEKCGTTTTVSSDVWYHVVATYDGTNIKMYLNGDLENTCSVSGSISSTDAPLIIGMEDGVTGAEFDGTIDAVGLWSDALTADEVEDIFWGGDYIKPIVNASGGGYAFNISAEQSQLKGFELQYTGSDEENSAQKGEIGRASCRERV